MLEDLIKTLKAQLYERVSSPLLMAFLLSWCIWNWRIFLILVGDADLQEKLSFTNEYFQLDWWPICRCSFGPLITALVYIFGYPYVATPVFEYTQKNQTRLLKIRQKYEDEKPISQEEARKLRQAAVLASIEYDNMVKLKDAQIEVLGKDNVSLKEALESARLASPAAPSNVGPDNPNPPLPMLGNVRQVGRTVAIPIREQLSDQEVEIIKFLLAAMDNDDLINRNQITLPNTPISEMTTIIDALISKRYLRQIGARISITPEKLAEVVALRKKDWKQD